MTYFRRPLQGLLLHAYFFISGFRVDTTPVIIYVSCMATTRARREYWRYFAAFDIIWLPGHVFISGSTFTHASARHESHIDSRVSFFICFSPMPSFTPSLRATCDIGFGLLLDDTRWPPHIGYAAITVRRQQVVLGRDIIATYIEQACRDAAACYAG